MSRRRKPPVGDANAWWKTGRKEYYEYALEEMPAGAIKADLSKHAQHNSYGPPLWYVDQRRKCRDCGKEFLFSAKEQQHWYEIVRLPIQVTAVRAPPAERRSAAPKPTNGAIWKTWPAVPSTRIKPS